MSKILFYFSDHGANHERRAQNTYGGVGYYRVVKPSEQAKKAGHEVTLWGSELTKKGETPEGRWARIFKDHDVFWSSYFSDPREASALFYTRDKLKKKVIIDVDDNFLDVLESHPLYDKLKAGKRDKAFMTTILSFADVIVCSTEPLKQRFRKHFKEVHNLEKKFVVLPNMNDIRDWNVTPAPKHENKIVIGYTGSNSHQEDLKMFFPHLLNVMKKYPNVYFESIGSISKDMLYMFEDFPMDVMQRCDIMPASWTFKDYPAHLASMKWDIGVAPLVDNAFTRGKSHIKWMEYAALKIPCIASRVYPYFMDIKGKKTIEHGKTGILVKPSEWTAALEDLILNKEKRLQLGENAYNFIKSDWQYDDSNIPEVINDVLKMA